MEREQHRHDISDSAWEKIRPYTISEKGTRGGNARDTRQFIDGVVLRFVTQKTSLFSLLLSRFVVLRFAPYLLTTTCNIYCEY